MKHAFVTVSDHAFYPGMLATVNSILHFHDADGLEIVVVEHEAHPLSAAQRKILAVHPRVRVIGSAAFAKNGRKIGPWELKAYTAADLCADYDVLVGIDSDCLLCAPVDDEIERCLKTGGFLGGKDGGGTDYDASYAPYGIHEPAHNPTYMSASLYFVAATERNQEVLRAWARRCNEAEFNGTGPCPGHGDQGVLNAVLFAMGRTQDMLLLDNEVWSQHWRYWDTCTDWRDGRFVHVGRTTPFNAPSIAEAPRSSGNAPTATASSASTRSRPDPTSGT